MVSVFFFFLPNCFLLTSKFTHVPLCVCINNKLYMGMQRERRSTDAAVALSFLSSARSVRRFAPRRCSFFFFYPFVCERKKKKIALQPHARQCCRKGRSGRQETHAQQYIYIHTHMLAYQRTLEKVISFLLLFASANVAVLIQKKEGRKKKRRRRKGKCGTVMSPFFFFNDKRNKGKERENLTSTIFQIFSEEDSCARVRTTYSLSFFFFREGRGTAAQE